MAHKIKQKKSGMMENLLDDHNFLSQLVVGIGEVSEITGIPQRQIRYWQEKGIIKTINSSITTRRYNYFEIKKILLIKELLDEGYTLDAAAEKLAKRMESINSTFNRFKKSSNK